MGFGPDRFDSLETLGRRHSQPVLAAVVDVVHSNHSDRPLNRHALRLPILRPGDGD